MLESKDLVKASNREVVLLGGGLMWVGEGLVRRCLVFFVVWLFRSWWAGWGLGPGVVGSDVDAGVDVRYGGVGYVARGLEICGQVLGRQVMGRQVLGRNLVGESSHHAV